MSKYTTEVRYICETYAGLTESAGFNSVDDVLDDSWDKVFTTGAEVYGNRKEDVCKKILKHYYTREIGAETVGLWKLWMNTRFEEIMPYYNKLYESAAAEINYLNDVDYTRTINEAGENSSEKTGSGTHRYSISGERQDSETTNTSRDVTRTDARSIGREGDNTSTTSATGENKNLYSDTPQGGLQNFTPDATGSKYLTDARLISDTQTGSQHDIIDETTNDELNSTEQTEDEIARELTGTTSTIDSGTNSSTEALTGESSKDTTEHVVGRQAGPASRYIEEYRKTLLNIDLMVIDQFKDLFFGLW